jgi:hypothetical protein
MTFHITSVEKGYDIRFNHYDYKTYPREIVSMERSKLDQYNVIDADEFIRTHTKEQADAWGIAHINKTIWIIDRNDFYNELKINGISQIGSLPKIVPMMKLIETTIYPEQYPSPPRVIYEYVN